jgi:WD40 repeat protein
MASAIVPQSVLSKAQIYGAPHLHTDGDILALRFGADGTLWSVEEPGVIRQWNVVTGQPVRYHALSNLEMVWNFSPDARLLASGGDDLSLWETEEGNLLYAIPQETWVTALAFHPQSRMLATGHDDGVVRCWDAQTLKCLGEFHHHKEPVSTLAFTADGAKLASAAEDKLIALWDLDSGQHLGTLEGHTDRIPDLIWHPDGDVLVSAGWDTTARVWDTTKLEPIILLNSHAPQVFALAFSKDGKWLACADSANKIHIWSFADKKTIHVLSDNETQVRQLAFSPDGKLLACGGESVIYLRNPMQGKIPEGEQPQAGQSMAMSLSPDGKRIAINGSSGLRVWDAEARQSLLLLEEEEPVHALAHSPDGKWIAGGTDTHVRIWEAATGNPHTVCEGLKAPVTKLAFAPDSKTLAAGSQQETDVWLFSPETGEAVLLIPDPLNGSAVWDLAFHPEGRLLAVAAVNQLATSGSSGGISVWDVKDRKPHVEMLGGCTCLAFHPSGKQLASGTVDPLICVWDFETRELIKDLAGHDETINIVVFSPDGKWLVSGSDDLTLRFWNTARWTEVAVRQIDSQIKHLAFSPDGKYLFAANANLRCYRFEVKELLEE